MTYHLSHRSAGHLKARPLAGKALEASLINTGETVAGSALMGAIVSFNAVRGVEPSKRLSVAGMPLDALIGVLGLGAEIAGVIPPAYASHVRSFACGALAHYGASLGNSLGVQAAVSAGGYNQTNADGTTTAVTAGQVTDRADVLTKSGEIQIRGLHRTDEYIASLRQANPHLSEAQLAALLAR